MHFATQCSRLGPAAGSARSRLESWSRRLALRPQRILFVCTANVDRSRTAQDLYKDDHRYEVESAGTAPFATTLLTPELLYWADRIFVMCEREDRHHTQIKMRFPGVKADVKDLDIEDHWPRGHPELVKRLLKKLRPHLGDPQPANAAETEDNDGDGGLA